MSITTAARGWIGLFLTNSREPSSQSQPGISPLSSASKKTSHTDSGHLGPILQGYDNPTDVIVEDGYIRVVVTRGSGSLGLDPNRCGKPQIIIITDSIALYPNEYYQNGLEIITSSVQRMHPTALSPRIKSLNYLNNILAKIEGLQGISGESGDWRQDQTQENHED